MRKIATENAKGFVPKLPKDSFVIVSRISKSDDLFISMMSEIEGLALDVNDTIVINGGKNDGIVISEKVQSELEKVIQQCNKIYATLTAFASGASSIYGVGGVMTTSMQGAMLNSTLTIPPKTVFENEKIKH